MGSNSTAGPNGQGGAQSLGDDHLEGAVQTDDIEMLPAGAEKTTTGEKSTTGEKGAEEGAGDRQENSSVDDITKQAVCKDVRTSLEKPQGSLGGGSSMEVDKTAEDQNAEERHGEDRNGENRNDQNAEDNNASAGNPSTADRQGKKTFVAAGTEIGLASDTRRNVGKENVMPTFTAHWADVGDMRDAMSRSVSSLVRKTISEDRIDEKLLSGKHIWVPSPVNVRSFQTFTAIASASSRRDMHRFREMSTADQRSTLDIWSQFCQDRTWYLIPSTVKSDRTFCRDIEDVYYIDAMDSFLSSNETRDPENISPADFPIFRNYLLPRWWCQFHFMKEFFVEEFIRRQFRMMIPYDAYESVSCRVSELENEYPPTPDWYDEFNFPSLLGAPLPFVYYYYYKELCDGHKSGTETSRIRLLQFTGKVEYCALIAAMWWNQCKFGGKMVVLDRNTIDRLSGVLQDVVLVEDLPTSALIQKMYSVANSSRRQHNWLHVRPPFLPVATFVKCMKGSGKVLEGAESGEHWTYDARGRRLKLSLRHNRREELRRSSPMTMHFTRHDINQIQGLLSYVDRNCWMLGDRDTGEVSVFDLVGYLSDAVFRMEEELSKARDDAAYNRSRGDRLVDRTNDLHSRIRQLEQTVATGNADISWFRTQIQDLVHERDDLRKNLDVLRREAGEARVEKERLLQSVDSLKFRDRGGPGTASDAGVPNVQESSGAAEKVAGVDNGSVKEHAGSDAAATRSGEPSTVWKPFAPKQMNRKRKCPEGEGEEVSRGDDIILVGNDGARKSGETEEVLRNFQGPYSYPG